MEKFGIITFKKDNKDYYFTCTEEGVSFERIDIYQNVDNYNMLNSSHCDASYIRRNTEFILGDENLIKAFKESRSRLSSLHAKTEQDVVIGEDGYIYLTLTKQNKELGMVLKQVMRNALPFSEYWETEEVIVQTGSITNNKEIIATPVNMDAYDRYDILSGFRQDVSGGSSDLYSLEYLISKYHLEHIEENDFVVVGSMEEGRKRLYEWRDAPTKVKAVDLETTGTDIWMYGADCITGVVLSYSETDGTYFPFRQEELDYNLPISFLTDILDTINNQPEDVKIVAHNGKFELEGVWKEYESYIKYSPLAEKFDTGFLNALKKTHLRIDADTLVLSVLVNPIFKVRGAHSLKTLVQKITGKIYLELENIFKGDIQFNKLPKEYIRYYACPDTANTIKVYNYLIDKLPKGEIWLYEEVESPLIYVTAENEFYGLNTNEHKLISNLKNEQHKVDTLTTEFRKIHKLSENDNINSPDLRRRILYEKLRCPIEVYTNKKLPSTSKVALKRIVDLGTTKEKVANKEMSDYKDLQGKTYVKADSLLSNRYPSVVILQAITKAEKELGAFKRLRRTSTKGRVKFNINQMGAATGRRTSNAHQFSDAMKSCIVADSSQHYFWSADYKQVELRVLAYLAKQYDLIELQKNWELDIHRAILSIIKKKPIWTISDLERKKGKSVNFGVVYMMSKYGLAQSSKGPAYDREDLIEAETAITDFYNGLPAIKKYVAGNEEMLKRDGWIKTEFGRRRELYGLLDPEVPEKMKKSLIRAGNNTPVQGFAADLLKWVEVTLRNYILEKGWDEKVDCDGVMLPMVRLMLSVHDEILLSSHKSIPIEEIILMLKICMEKNIEGAPPFFAAPAMVENWLCGKSDAYEIPIGLRDDVIKAWTTEHKTLVHPETYLKDLDGYRMGRLRNYMNNLITNYKTKEMIAKHVTHDTFTHELLSVFSNTDRFPEDKQKTHEERILASVERYMNSADAEISILSEDRQETESILETITEINNDIETFIDFDQYGRAILPEEEEEEDDDLERIKEYYPPYLNKVEKPYALYFLDQVWIDLSKFKGEELEAIHQELATLRNEKEAYHVYYMLPGKFDRPISMDYKIGYVKKEIDVICKKYVKEGIYA